MLLYLDNSVLNRPFDDQRQPRIWLEMVSFSLVLTLIEAAEAKLIHSPIHDLENGRNPFPLRRRWIESVSDWRKRALRSMTRSNRALWPWSTLASKVSTLCTSLALKPPAQRDS